MSRPRNHQLLARLGARIRELRLSRGMTQQQLAEVIGVEPETVSRAETGASAISIDRLAKVARALDVTLAQVVDIGGEVPAPGLPPDELEILRRYRAIDEAGRALALEVIRQVERAWTARSPAR